MLFSMNIHIFWTCDFQQRIGNNFFSGLCDKLLLLYMKENHIYSSAILKYITNCLLLMVNIFKTLMERFSVNFYFSVFKCFEIGIFPLCYNISCLSAVGNQPVISQGFWKLVSEEAD